MCLGYASEHVFLSVKNITNFIEKEQVQTLLDYAGLQHLPVQVLRYPLGAERSGTDCGEVSRFINSNFE
jgi:hypothetical protein